MDLEVNTEKTECMVVSCHQNTGQNYNLLITNKAFETVKKIKHLGRRVTNQTLPPKQTKTD
jgi:hypothetical protein